MQTVPTKSVALGRNCGHATARSPAEFEVEARNAAERPSKQGGDQIKFKLSAPANTTVATISELPEGRYKVEFMAPIVGTYQLTVQMNGEHISGSPFKLTVTHPRAQADLCTLAGRALTRLTAGEVGTFTVSFIDKLGNQAPPEELDIRVKPSGSPDLPRDEEGDLVVPERVQKTFASFDADGSGDIDFSELRLALAQLGMDGDRKAAAVLLRRYDSDGGGLSIQEFTMLVADMQMAQSTGYLLRGVVPSENKGSRDVKIEIRVAGDYEMAIGFAAASGGGALPGSPYTLTVFPGKASPETTELPSEFLTGLKTAVGESGSFLLQAKDQFKNLSIKGGDRIRVSTTSSSLSAEMKDLQNGTYEITYRCDESGIHNLSVTIGEKNVKGSPLAVTCEPGPINVPSCELLHSGVHEDIIAGTEYTLKVRARDRFGNETANVNSSGVGFAVEMQPAVPDNGGGVGRVNASSGSPAMRERLGSIFGSPRGNLGGPPPATPTLGRMASCEGRWLDGGIYEITYVPATRGVFELHVVCVRDIEGADEPERSPVSSFFPIPVAVAPLGPDAQMSILLNANRWHHAAHGAGTRLLMLIHLRDRFGNACHWPYEYEPRTEEEASTEPDQNGPSKVVSLPAVDPRLDEDLVLRVEMHMIGVALDDQEARPNELRVSPRDEAYGQYEARHTLSRAGRFTVILTLGGKPIGGSPLEFTVVAAKAAGIKTRLLLPAATADNKKMATAQPAEVAYSLEQNETTGSFKMSLTSSTTGENLHTPAAASETIATPLVGQLYRMVLRARDAFGNTVYRGGSNVEVAVVEPPVPPGSEYTTSPYHPVLTRGMLPVLTRGMLPW